MYRKVSFQTRLGRFVVLQSYARTFIDINALRDFYLGYFKI